MGFPLILFSMTCLSPGWMMLMCLNDMPAPRTTLVRSGCGGCRCGNLGILHTPHPHLGYWGLVAAAIRAIHSSDTLHRKGQWKKEKKIPIYPLRTI